MEPIVLERIEFSLYRESMYRSAASVFALEPTVQQLDQLIAAAISAGDDGFLRESEGCLLADMRTYANEDIANLRTTIATEYAELFVGPRPPLAPLYESVYVGALKRLNTEVTMQVRRCYEDAGFQVVKRDRIPNDHLAFELEFMAELCKREADALEQDNDDGAAQASYAREQQRAFLTDHLGVWIPAFCARLSEAWCADYYDAWARFVQAFVVEDIAYVNE